MDLDKVLQKLSQASTVPQTSVPKVQGQNFEEELKKVNQEIYERNVELSIRNRTFSILQRIYQIINTSLGTHDTAQRLIEAIIQELQFKEGLVALIDEDVNELSTVATYSSDMQAMEQLGYPFRNLRISLKNEENYCVKAILENKTRMTNSLYDIFTPHINEEEAGEIAKAINIQTCIVYPVVFGTNAMGVLMFGLDKHVGFLSRAEREILKELIEVVAIAIERAQLYEDLKDANERLKEVDKLKDEFVSVASHELRTPMTAIKSYLWMALAGKGGELSEKQKYYLDRAYNSCDRLIKLVNDMLNISRIESGRMSFTFAEVDMVTLVEDTFAEVKPRADELGLNLILSKPEEFLPHVIADTDKVKEVLINLIGNSLKFTPPGGNISVSFEVSENKVITHVVDNGAGIVADDMGKLFSKFGLLEGSYTNNRNVSMGTGLGLYICKNIIEIHKGKIWAYSAGKGKGSTFSFSLDIFNEQKLSDMNKEVEGEAGIGIIHTQL